MVRFSLALGIAALGCATLPAGSRMLLPSVTLSGLGGLHLEDVGVCADATLVVENPNPFPLVADRFTWQVALAGHPAGGGESIEGVTVPGFGTATVPVRLSMPTHQVLGSCWGIITEGTIPYRLDVVVYLNSKLGSFQIPVWTEGSVEIPALL